jgi:succinate dehydrogenase flavin-adding protein (antitoxin of CptAB toxin-antitoxin module)
MRELDALLEDYLAKRFPNADLSEQRGFAKLLELPDPVLYACLMGGATVADLDARRVVEHITGHRA